jgi:3D-(3,5/4)-trihydroxycyclohexane-1,2-dione acylhydrolase (decyclizing)
MNPTELVTAVQENLKVTVVLSENHGFQCIRALQLARAGRSFGNEFRSRDGGKRLDGEYLPIDFAKNAEAFGARVWSVSTPDELCSALRDARQEKRTCVIVAETDKDRLTPGSGAWWDFGVAEVSEDPIARDLRVQYERERQLQRFFY